MLHRRFDQIIHDNVNFYNLCALRRIALANGHTGMIEHLSPDYADIITLLIRAKRKIELEAILKDFGKHIPHYVANAILMKYMKEDLDIDADIIELLLDNTKVTPYFQTEALDILLDRKIPDAAISRVMRKIIFEPKFRTRWTNEFSAKL